MVIYNVKDDDSFDVYQQEGIKVRLGEGLDEKGKLGKKPMIRAIDTLQVFRDIIQLNPIKSVLPIATSAVREASNREEFLNIVSKETGFDFKVLSEREEALYSYVGAIKSLHIPDALFFDIGGGSLEIVYAEKFKIKKVISLPLGALRLTHQFDGRKGKFTDKNFKSLKRHIWDLLPNKKDLGLSKDTKLVGVGGALRALARYEQRISKYPLDKTHNYKISRKSLDFTVNDLSRIKPDDMSKISVIGASRAETIIAGSCVIDMMMEKYDFSEMHVSNHGLREGALSLFLEDPKMYNDGYLTAEQIRKTIGLDEQHKSSPEKENFINALLSIKLISKRERKILDHAEKILSEKSSFSNPQSVFYSIMDEDMPLEHNDQLVLGLALVHARHTKTSEWLFTRYKTILSQQDKVSMKKISALVTLRRILERTKSRVELKSHGSRILEITVIQSRSTQKFLLKDALRKFEIAFDIEVILSTRPYAGSSQNSILEF
ncbi:MAG: Ppx/GppA family phosphatase [Thaumarchaeota archaeon]|nr:Ppx/GppA family phosphatase [Nitrososphaerota archaeon]